MTRQRRLFISAAALLIGVLCVGFLGSWFILRSSWFRDEVRRRVVAEVELTTGGKVEIKSFDYTWQTLTAEFRGFVVHGTEPPGSAPLLNIDTLRITLRIISIVKRSIDLDSLVVEHPQVNLLIAADGTTNLPSPAKKSNGQPIDDLLNLKLRHFEVNNGLLEANDQHLPLDARGDGLALLVKDLAKPPRYAIQLSSQHIVFNPVLVHSGPLQLTARALLERDRLTVEQFDLAGAGSTLNATGDIEHFATPGGNFKLDADLTTEQVASLANIPELHGGHMALHGKSHYDQLSGPSFAGHADITRAAYISKVFTLKNVDVASDVAASRAGAKFTRLTASTNGTRFSGDGTLNPRAELDLNGNLTGLALREAASFFTGKYFAWSATAGGKVRLTATLDRHAADIAVTSRLHLTPAPQGIPISGDVELNYRQRGNLLDFGESQLSLPASHLSFAGAPRGDSRIVFDSSNLVDLNPLLTLVSAQHAQKDLPVLGPSGNAHFDGVISDLLTHPHVAGNVGLLNFKLLGQTWDQLQSRLTVAQNGVDFASLDVRQGASVLTAAGLLGLEGWAVQAESPIRGAIHFSGVDVGKTVAQLSNFQLPIIRGVAAGTMQVSGTIAQPQGSGHFTSDSLDAYGGTLNKVQFDAGLEGNKLLVTDGKLSTGAAALRFSGDYEHNTGDWRGGQAHIKLDSNGFPIASLSPVRKFEPGLDARAEVHFDGSARVSPHTFVPVSANGTVDFRDIALNKVPYGNLSVKTNTQGQTLDASLTGQLLQSRLRGQAKIALSACNLVNGEVVFDRTNLAALYAVTGSRFTGPFDGFLEGRLDL